MTPERWQQIEVLYYAAMERAPDARTAFGAVACANDTPLQHEVEKLLAMNDAAGSFLAMPAMQLEGAFPAMEMQLGNYQLLGQLGAGGMGVVYRARDTRLNRDVAIKVLPADFARDADRLRRFELEAKATGSLNHPNILTIYDIGTHDGTSYLVAELLEGEELRVQLNHGALPMKRAIEYAQQIAAGLTAAHAKGIVHRDLKPENLFVTKDGRIKILDFGLAKMEPPQNVSAGSDVATLKQLTTPGTVMGTVAYMSPEQVRGEAVDARSDLFSFGLILYEMLTGKRAFEGATMADLMSAILREEPPELSAMNPQINPQLEKIVQRCLEKKAEARFQTASDLGFALSTLTATSGARVATAKALPAVTEPIRQAPWLGNVRLWMVVAAVAILAALVFAVAYFRRAPVESPLTYTYLPLPEKSTTTYAGGGMAMSPDGRRLVMTVEAEGVRRLWLYSLDRPSPVLLAGTEGARYPFWSPNGRSIGFFAQSKLKRLEIAGGAPSVLCDVTNGVGGAWSSSGEILFVPNAVGYGLYRIAETGGTPSLVTSLDRTRAETGHVHPVFLPDGRHFLFLANALQPDHCGIRVGSLDSPQTSFLVRTRANAAYAAGYLLFMQGRKILAQPFDAAKLTLSGEPMPVSEPVPYAASSSFIDFSVFSDRLLCYRNSGNVNAQLAWVDRKGTQLSSVGPAGEYSQLNLSPNKEQVLLDRLDPQRETKDIWQFDLRRETLTRLTSNGAFIPIWAPDGNSAVYLGLEGFLRVTGGGNEELLFELNHRGGFALDWSMDGKFIVYRIVGEKTGNDLGVLSLSDRQTHDYLATPFDEFWAKISPDGHWLAYQSNESGRNEIYVQSFPEPGHKVTVSQGGGTFPRWRADGKELFYVGADDKLMAVPVATGASFTVGAPVALFEVGAYGRSENRYAYDVSADGQKFLLLRPLEDNSLRPLTVVQNWTELLKK